jgi:hypothetical protein
MLIVVTILYQTHTCQNITLGIYNMTLISLSLFLWFWGWNEQSWKLGKQSQLSYLPNPSIYNSFICQ